MTQTENLNVKPLGGKAYGSIPHLPNSRVGPGDYHCHEGQARIVTEKARDLHDEVFVMEKVDGACVSVANIGGTIQGVIRAGYTAETAKYEHLRVFGAWVRQNAEMFRPLQPGQRLCGEWMALAHGTKYTMLPRDPFVVFDGYDGKKRMPLLTARELAYACGQTFVPIVGTRPMSITDALAACGDTGYFGAIGGVEGVVYRVERKGVVDFLAKYVRPDKVDGCFLPEIAGCDPHWHFTAEQLLQDGLSCG